MKSPRLGRVLDDIAAEVITRLPQAVIPADLRIDVVLVVGCAGNGAFPNQRLASSGDQDFHLRAQADTEFGRTVVIIHIAGIVTAHRGRNADKADIEDAVGLFLGNKLEGIIALETGGNLLASKFREQRFARIVADGADGNRLDLRVRHGSHVVVTAAEDCGANATENKGAEGPHDPERTEISTLHRNLPFLHKIRGNPS